ncbi:MAG: VanZ family protein [Phycisphaerales bacterium]|nr:VanZ family protein [Phycisphaerales bacterium]
MMTTARSTDTPEPLRTPAAWRRIVRRPWRIAFILYAIALTLATHWPKLTLPPTGPSDKTTHLISFGMLTFLLWRTGWVRSRILTVIIALSWSQLDELSQSFEILGRDVTWLDALANALGVLLVGTWLWTLRPVGMAPNRLRLARHAFIFDVIFASVRTWMMLIAAGVSIAIATAITWKLIDDGAKPTVMLLSPALLLFIIALLMHRWWKRTAAQLVRDYNCFACGTPNDVAATQCRSCATPLRADQWTEPPPPTRRWFGRAICMPMVIGLAIIPAPFLALAGLVKLYEWTLDTPVFPSMRGVTRWIMSAPEPVQNIIDLALLGVLIAGIVRIVRRRLARHYDQSVRCRSCGHDLRGASIDNNAGHCAECGEPFDVIAGG